MASGGSQEVQCAVHAPLTGETWREKPSCPCGLGMKCALPECHSYSCDLKKKYPEKQKATHKRKGLFQCTAQGAVHRGRKSRHITSSREERIRVSLVSSLLMPPTSRVGLLTPAEPIEEVSHVPV